MDLPLEIDEEILRRFLEEEETKKKKQEEERKNIENMLREQLNTLEQIVEEQKKEEIKNNYELPFANTDNPYWQNKSFVLKDK